MYDMNYTGIQITQFKFVKMHLLDIRYKLKGWFRQKSIY